MLLVAAEAVLALALAGQGARLAWAFVTPHGPFGEAPRTRAMARPAADLSIFASFDPFFRIASGSAAARAQSPSGGVVLYGVRSGGPRPSAILAAGGGPQRSVGVGEEVEPGLVLAHVRTDHVVLARGVARQRVGFPTPQPGAALPLPEPTLATQPSAPAGPNVDPRRLLGQSTLTPRLKGGQPAGYTIFPRGGSDALRQAGLQTGDVLLSVDGVPLTPERVSELPQSLSASSAAEIRFERGGQILTTRIQMAQP